MNEKELTAYALYLEMSHNLKLDEVKWLQYISLSKELTGRKLVVKKCINQLKRAHTYLSQYFKDKYDL